MIQIGLYSNDCTLQSLLSSAFAKEFDVSVASVKDQIRARASLDRCELLILDLDSTQGSSSEALVFARELIASQTPLIILASDSLRTRAVELVRDGAYGYCRRPPSIRDLRTMLVRAHESSSLRRQLLNIQQPNEGNIENPLIGSTPQMKRVYDLMERVANINASVLITGESGTGKELIANGIHNRGIRHNRPFVAVCCGAIPESLIEAELFGHEKGAFTGTVGTRVGYLEQAGDGTLFLDEIGELSLATQVKLLRVLQQREFSRLGSSRLIPLRARLIFATHQNLGEMVAQGTFRQDFYYRINVVRIDAPPLRERSEDIPQLAAHFLNKYSRMFERPVTGIDSDAVAMLQGYSWPGNVRELENIIQRAIIVGHGDTLRLEDLPITFQEQNIIEIDEYQPGGSFERQLRNYKLKLATAALRDNNGNKTLAARSLNISRAYLHRLIRVTEHDEPDLEFEQDGSNVETA